MAPYNISNSSKILVRVEIDLIELAKDDEAYVVNKIDDLIIDNGSNAQNINGKKEKDINDNDKRTDENENYEFMIDVVDIIYGNNDCNMLSMKHIHVFKKRHIVHVIPVSLIF